MLTKCDPQCGRDRGSIKCTLNSKKIVKIWDNGLKHICCNGVIFSSAEKSCSVYGRFEIAWFQLFAPSHISPRDCKLLFAENWKEIPTVELRQTQCWRCWFKSSHLQTGGNEERFLFQRLYLRLQGLELIILIPFRLVISWLSYLKWNMMRSELENESNIWVQGVRCF